VNRLAATNVNPKELLWGIILSLSKMKEAHNWVLPDLLERSKTVLAIDNLTMMPPAANSRPQAEAVIEVNDEDQVDAIFASLSTHDR
jgi:hypothetical protein